MRMFPRFGCCASIWLLIAASARLPNPVSAFNEFDLDNDFEAMISMQQQTITSTITKTKKNEKYFNSLNTNKDQILPTFDNSNSHFIWPTNGSSTTASKARPSASFQNVDKADQHNKDAEENDIVWLMNENDTRHLQGNANGNANGNSNGNNNQQQSCPLNTAMELSYQMNVPASFVESTVGKPSSLPPNRLGSCHVNRGSPTAWFQLFLPSDSSISISTCSESLTEFDTVLTLFGEKPDNGGASSDDEEDDCGLECIDRNDDHGGVLPVCTNTNSDGNTNLHSSLQGILEAGTYYIAVSGFRNFAQGQFELTLFVSPPPEFICPLSLATPISYEREVPVSVSGTTEDADSTLPNINLCSINAGSPTTWYEFEVPVDSSIEISTCSQGTKFDTILNLFIGRYNDNGGDECAAACIGRNDDHSEDSLGSPVIPSEECVTGSGLHSAIEVASVPPGTYYVAISGYRHINFGEFELNVLVGPPLAFDCSFFNTATTIDFELDTPLMIRGTTLDAPSNLPEMPPCSIPAGSPTVWYKFQVPATNEPVSVFVNTCSEVTEFDTILTLFRSESTDSSTCDFDCVWRNDDHEEEDTTTTIPTCTNVLHSAIEREIREGTYYLAVSGFNPPEFGSFELDFMVGPVREPDCPIDNSNPITFDLEVPQKIGGTTAGGLTNLPEFELECTIADGSPTTWYEIEAEEEMVMSVSTCSFATTFDTVLTLFRADPDGEGCALECVDQNDDYEINTGSCSEENQSTLEVLLSPGTYYLAVSGFGEDDLGVFELDLFVTPPIPVDCFLSSATQLTYNLEQFTSVTGTTSRALPSLPDDGTTCSFATGSPTVWYQFATPVDVSVIISTCSISTAFDTVLTLYRGISAATCTYDCIDRNDDHEATLPACKIDIHSAIQTTLSAGSYYVAVSGFSSRDSGEFELSLLVSTNIPDVNDV